MGALARAARLLRGVLAQGLGASSPLVLARLASAVVTFALPLVLARLLEPEAYGTYKQFFLVGQTALLAGQIGLCHSLFYFLPRGGRERGSYVAHAAIGLGAIGSVAAVTLLWLAPWLSARLGSDGLSALGVPLALYAGAMLAAAPLEGALTAEGRPQLAAVSYLTSDALRAAVILTCALLLGGRALFWGATGVAVARMLAFGALVASGRIPHARPRRELLARQLAFALPLAGAGWLFVGQRTFAQYAVSAHSGAAIFALFSVASFHLPAVDIIYTPMSEVLSVQLGRCLTHGGEGRLLARAEFRAAVTRLAGILWPAAALGWVVGPVLLPLLFGVRYRGAVPLFLLSTCEIPLWCLPLDALIRAAGDTRFLLAFNVGRLAVTASLVSVGLWSAGPKGAIVGGIVAEVVARAGLLRRGAQLLGGGVAELLDLRSLRTLAWSAFAPLGPALALRLLCGGGRGATVGAAAAYGAAALALRVGRGAPVPAQASALQRSPKG